MTRQPDHPLLELPAFAAGSLDSAQAGAVETHIVGCDECRTAVAEWRVVRDAVQATAAEAPAPSRGLIDRAFAKIDRESRPPRWRDRWLPAGLRRPAIQRSLAGVAAAAALVVAVTSTPLGSYAQGLFEVSQPRQFAVVPVSMADVEALPRLDQYGDFSFTSGGGPQAHADAAAASAATGLSVLVPEYLPPSVSASPTYLTLPTQSGTFTFSAAKAQAAAQAQGAALPPVPASIDGASVQMTLGDTVVAVYGGLALLKELAGPVAAAPEAADASPLSGLANLIPQLVIVKTEAPVATVTGTSVEELRQYLLDQPGISDELAGAIRAIGDPTTTWPIPVPAGELETRAVTVQGVPATAFSDPSGFAAGVVWVRDGFVYAVAAPLDEGEVIEIADSLR